MARVPKYALRVVILAVIAVAAVLVVRHYTKAKVISVVLTPVERGVVQETVSNTRAGTVKACRRAHLSPAFGGQVAQLAVREGDQVKKDQVLLVLWNDDLEARVKLAASEELTASAKVQEACLNADVAQREAERQQRLASQKLVSEEVVDRATTEAKPGPCAG